MDSLTDLSCLLRFIGITGGLKDLEIFNRILVRPLRKGGESATFLLQAIVTAFTPRRRKERGSTDLRLSKLDEYLHRIDFTPKERERYEVLIAEAQCRLQQFERKRTKQGTGAGQAF